MWLATYDYSLSTIKNGRDQGNAMDLLTTKTKYNLVDRIRHDMMDQYAKAHCKRQDGLEDGIKYLLYVKSIDGNIYCYDLIDLDDLDKMDKEFYKLEYEEYMNIRQGNLERI